MTKRDLEKRVLRAVKRWFIYYGADEFRWGKSFPADDRLAKAYAALARKEKKRD